MSDATVALLVLAAVIGLFVWNRLSVGIVALGTVLALWATGLLTLEQATSGFGDPVIVFIASLFVVSEAIDSAGVTTWAGQKLVAVAGEGRTRLTVAVMLLCAVLTALISLNGSVAALLPMVVVLAMRLGLPSSQLLMPMVFAGSAGSLLVLTGSPVNVIVSNASAAAGEGTFAFFEFAWVGVPILLGTIVLGLVLGPRLIPERAPRTSSRDLSRHAETLARYYALDDGFYRLRVRQRSPLIGTAPDDVELSAYEGVRLIGLQAGVAEPVRVRHEVDADDVLVVSGPPEQISRMAVEQVLAVSMTPLTKEQPDRLVNREVGVVEVVVPPRSPLVGERIFPGMVRSEDLVILGIQRRGDDTGPGEVEIAPGDALLLYGAWDGIDNLADHRDVLIVDSPDLMRRQSVPLGARAKQAIAILAGMVLLLALGLVPPAVAGLLAAGAMVLTRVISSPQAYRAVSWETVVLVGGLIPLSTAITDSGAADLIAERITSLVGDGSAIVLMLTLFALTCVLGLVISNTATVLIVLPIALAVATESDIAVQPILMVIAVAASAALLTPVQTPGNMMIMAPGGYRFGDYWRLGLLILLWWLVVALVVIPFVWPL